MTQARGSFRIVQFSDIHCGDPRFDGDLMDKVIEEANEADPDLVVVPGDLTAAGYREQFEQAKGYLDRIECDQRIVIAGNHDCRNVGYLYFEHIIGSRYATVDFDFAVACEGRVQDRVKVVAVDSNKPDLNDGEVGRGKYDWIKSEFQDPSHYKVFVLHHHLVSVPGTGRERNIVWDAGDVLRQLREAGADLVLAGHKHVPFVWPVAGMLIVNSGTACTWRTRGYQRPSYNIIEIGSETTTVSTRVPGEAKEAKEVYSRAAVKGGHPSRQ
ncbi:MAG: metallophosphoesterase family protein [Terriglobia bacterium]